MVGLRAPISEAIALYGEPLESKARDDFPDATEYLFRASQYHEAVIYEWKGRIHSITYWSSHPDPVRDLRCMFERFGEGRQWQALTEGYLYMRDDARVRLWCSAAPGIGVATDQYLDAEREEKKRRPSDGRIVPPCSALEIGDPSL